MKKIMVVFGTRPEGIKMMPVVRALKAAGGLDVTVVVTGQHREMLSPIFDVFEESYDVNLDIMTKNQTLADLTGGILGRMSAVIEEQKPDLVLVHGDTTTAFAASVAAFYCRRRIGHVEAGLRSFDLERPWPEEFNRVAIDCVSEYMFAPTPVAARNIENEYGRRQKIYVTGNTGIDALMYVAHRLEQRTDLVSRLDQKYEFLPRERRLVVVTGHRRESFGDGFKDICAGLRDAAARFPIEIVYPVHLNPNVREAVNASLTGISNLHLLDPVDYVDMVYLMKRAYCVVTDSGGIQEEAPALGKPVLVMRDVTERPEAVETGVVKLVGTKPSAIIDGLGELMQENVYRQCARSVFPYGDGRAALKIAAIIKEGLRP